MPIYPVELGVTEFVC